MRHDCGGSTLGTETIGGGGRCGKWCAQHLYGDVATKRFIGGAEDECGSPFADQLLQSIATSNNVAWLQGSLLPLRWAHRAASPSAAIASCTTGP